MDPSQRFKLARHLFYILSIMLFKMAESVFFIFVVEPSDVKGTVSWPRRTVRFPLHTNSEHCFVLKTDYEKIEMMLVYCASQLLFHETK
jgi:hypothetical protein